MSVRVEFRWSEELLGAVDAARGDVSRAVWVRRAVEYTLRAERRQAATEEWGEHPGTAMIHDEGTGETSFVPHSGPRRVQSSAQAKRDIKPIPKSKP